MYKQKRYGRKMIKTIAVIKKRVKLILKNENLKSWRLLEDHDFFQNWISWADAQMPTVSIRPISWLLTCHTVKPNNIWNWLTALNEHFFCLSYIGNLFQDNSLNVAYPGWSILNDLFWNQGSFGLFDIWSNTISDRGSRLSTHGP